MSLSYVHGTFKASIKHLCSSRNHLSHWRFYPAQDLPKELESELRGNVETVALALVRTAYEYDAYLLRKAMKVRL